MPLPLLGELRNHRGREHRDVDADTRVAEARPDAVGPPSARRSTIIDAVVCAWKSGRCRQTEKPLPFASVWSRKVTGEIARVDEPDPGPRMCE